MQLAFSIRPAKWNQWINIYYLLSLLFGPCQAERQPENIVFMIFFCTFSLWIFHKSIKKVSVTMENKGEMRSWDWKCKNKSVIIEHT